ncbi:MAG: D-alanyl-D-alanine carboxypeptidase/D-alanyl-D-alanine-endopeptidase [Gemmatimonadales bacterium]|nr:MAG: D-alanyl-D-alanine carboxypeptidase/D-alanyl-D-alanine-endopeptidase [Gemmatimonadales bacterium]
MRRGSLLVAVAVLAIGLVVPDLRPAEWQRANASSSQGLAVLSDRPVEAHRTHPTDPPVEADRPTADPLLAGDGPDTSLPTLSSGEESIRDRAATAAVAALHESVSAMIRSGSPASSAWGVHAVSLATGESLLEMNAELPLAPASNQKLFTSAAALERLGPDFRFPTFLVVRGTVDQGVLHGDLVLFGTGDPTLGARDPNRPTGAFRSFLDALEREGIHEIRGDVVGDGSFFGGDPRRPSWNPNDLNDWFAAPVSALSFNENVVTMRLLPGLSAGAAPRVLTIPEGAGIPVSNLARTVSTRPSPTLLMVRDDPDDPVEIRGQIHVNGGDVWRSLTVSDPPAYAASLLRETLVRNGVAVTGEARSLAREDSDAIVNRPLIGVGLPVARTIAVHHSPPLPELLEVVNRRSHNLFAELLLFTLGRTLDGDGTFEGGARALTAYLTDEVKIPATDIEIIDGSGLSRLNRATPSSFVRALAHIENSRVREPFFASLPEAGNARQLNRMHRSAAAGNLRAKTGTIHRTTALSGVVRSASGEPVLFSIIANDVPSPWAAKRIEDRIGIALADFLRPDPTPELRPIRSIPGALPSRSADDGQ